MCLCIHYTEDISILMLPQNLINLKSLMSLRKVKKSPKNKFILFTGNRFGQFDFCLAAEESQLSRLNILC